MKASPNEKTMMNLINRKHIKPYADALLGRGFRVAGPCWFTRTTTTSTEHTQDSAMLIPHRGRVASISLRRDVVLFADDHTATTATLQWESVHEGKRAPIVTPQLFDTLLQRLLTN